MRAMRVLSLSLVLALVGHAANATAVTLYDGAIGDADIRNQGLDFESPNGTAIELPNALPAGFTADAGDDSFSLIRPSVGSGNPTPIPFVVQLPLDNNDPLTADVLPLLGTDQYIFETTVAVIDPSAHSVADLELISGTESGSLGFRDRFFIRNNRFQLLGAHTDLGGFDKVFNPSEWGGTDLLSPTTLRVERDGLNVSMFVNDVQVYEGIGGTSGISQSQIEFNQNSINNDISFKIFSVSLTAVPEPSTALIGGVGLVVAAARRRV